MYTMARLYTIDPKRFSRRQIDDILTFFPPDSMLYVPCCCLLFFSIATLHEMSEPILWEKIEKKNQNVALYFPQHAKH